VSRGLLGLTIFGNYYIQCMKGLLSGFMASDLLDLIELNDLNPRP